jgi:hypothetical protein
MVSASASQTPKAAEELELKGSKLLLVLGVAQCSASMVWLRFDP